MDHPKIITAVEWCTGYGGLSLGVGLVLPGLRVIALSEIEAYACANLVAKMEGGLLDAAPIWTDCRTFPSAAFCERVGIFMAGYPCQPFSAAGQRRGSRDPRHLWPFIRIGYRAMRPPIVFFENVDGHVSKGLRQVLQNLETDGYRATWGIFSALEVGSTQVRKRVFIYGELASTGGPRLAREQFGGALPDREGIGASESVAELREASLANAIDLGGDSRRERARRETGTDIDRRCARTELANAGDRQLPIPERSSQIRSRTRQTGKTLEHAAQLAQRKPQHETLREPRDHPRSNPGGRRLPFFPPGPEDLDQWRAVLAIDPTLEPALCRLAHGRPSRVDELRLAGNGVVPLCAAKAFLTLHREMNPETAA